MMSQYITANGATKSKLSKRSSTPPCPGSNFPKSFMPTERLITDMDRSPNWPTKEARIRYRNKNPYLIFIPVQWDKTAERIVRISVCWG